MVMAMAVVLFMIQLHLQIMIKQLGSLLLFQSWMLLQGLLQVLDFLLGLLQLKIEPIYFAISILLASQLWWLFVSVLELNNEFIALDL